MLSRDCCTTEAHRQKLQAELDRRRSAAKRNCHGQFATPNALAVEIASYLAVLLGPEKSALHFADPAIGTGSFFSAALAVFGEERIASAFGVELDPEFCDAAKRLWGGFGLQVVNDDFTRFIANGVHRQRPNLILANPPYVRHHHLKREDKERLRPLSGRMTGVQISGLAGLYTYFLILATAWLEDGGFAAWLIPSEFMDVNYGAAIKQFLTDRVMLHRVHRFDPHDVQFGDALVSSVALFIQKHPPCEGHAVEFTLGGTIAKPQAAELVSLDRLRSSRKWTIYPCHASNDQTVAPSDDYTIADLFRVQRGIATGCNKFFILERADAQRRGFPTQYMRPILPSPRHLKTSIIDCDQDGYPRIDPQLCLIDCDLPEPNIAANHPQLWTYLQTSSSLGITDRYLFGTRSPWYKQEHREPAPFLSTYMGRGSDEQRPFRFIWNRSKAIGTNLYLMLYPRSNLATMLRHHPQRAGELYELLCQITGHELRGEGRVYGGGLHKIEPRELGRISAAKIIRRWPELTAGLSRKTARRLFD